MPREGETGLVRVTTGGSASNGVAFTVIPAPVITTISRTSGPKGTIVTIKGSNFGTTQDSSVVRFKGIKATRYRSWSDTQIKCKVPAKAATGKVKVTTAGGISNSITFTVTATPPVSAGPDQKVAAGDRVTLSGVNSGQVARGSVVSAHGGRWTDPR